MPSPIHRPLHSAGNDLKNTPIDPDVMSIENDYFFRQFTVDRIMLHVVCNLLSCKKFFGHRGNRQAFAIAIEHRIATEERRSDGAGTIDAYRALLL